MSPEEFYEEYGKSEEASFVEMVDEQEWDGDDYEELGDID